MNSEQDAAHPRDINFSLRVAALGAKIATRPGLTRPFRFYRTSARDTEGIFPWTEIHIEQDVSSFFLLDYHFRIWSPISIRDIRSTGDLRVRYARFDRCNSLSSPVRTLGKLKFCVMMHRLFPSCTALPESNRTRRCIHVQRKTW